MVTSSDLPTTGPLPLDRKPRPVPKPTKKVKPKGYTKKKKK